MHKNFLYRHLFPDTVYTVYTVSLDAMIASKLWSDRVSSPALRNHNIVKLTSYIMHNTVGQHTMRV